MILMKKQEATCMWEQMLMIFDFCQESVKIKQFLNENKGI